MSRLNMSTNKTTWLLGVLLLAPIQLGAKGCGTGVVGDDGTGGGAGLSTGGASSSTGGAASTTGGSSSNPAKTCGGLTGAACGTGEFCDYPPDAQCGAADQTGTCKTIPDACTTIYAPVCGCDDKTYGNECSAWAAGVSVAAQGVCATTPGNACGGLTGAPCGQDEFCNYPKEALCGAADQMGTCTLIPEVCDAMYAPVCGCDGKTYSSECTAWVAGVSVAADGTCATTGATVCGGIAALQCKTGEYCNYPLQALCGAADQTGTCATIPAICTKEYVPVCGCNGQTYGNSCEAAAAGVSVAASGTCSN